MSTSTKRKHSSALFDAHEFREMFSGTFEQWEIAGSLRRKKPEVGDVEHVVIPRIVVETIQKGFFETEEIRINLVWLRAEALLKAGTISKHQYPNEAPRWGEKYRGIDYRGFAHEIFLADDRNFGSVLAIRTGPAEFSKSLVCQFHKPGRTLIQAGGYVRYKATDEIFAVPTEEAYFKACGVPFLAPEKRLA